MLMYMTTWVQTHGKLLALVGATTTAIGGGALRIVTYVDDVDDRLTAVETEVVHGDSAINEKLDVIQTDVSQVKCMTLLGIQGGDPLDCLYD